MTFREREYQERVRQIQQTHHGFSLDDALFRVACECKLVEEPAIPLTSREILGGLRAALYRPGLPCATEELLRRFAVILSLLPQHVPHGDPAEPSVRLSEEQVELIGAVVATAWVLRDVLPVEERVATAKFLRAWADAVCDESWIRAEWCRIHSSDEWLPDADNEGIADVGEAMALLEIWGEPLPQGRRR